MVVTAKLSQKPFIELPMEVYESFNLKEGDNVQIFITPTATKMTKQEKLARLEKSRGIWADDENIKAAFEYLERKWAEWKPIEF
jgi:bifunctional DNA-binding transcriptional regulator/antitoxin component of YhaV-PrlF toxin-antitoxin module